MLVYSVYTHTIWSARLVRRSGYLLSTLCIDTESKAYDLLRLISCHGWQGNRCASNTGLMSTFTFSLFIIEPKKNSLPCITTSPYPTCHQLSNSPIDLNFLLALLPQSRGRRLWHSQLPRHLLNTRLPLPTPPIPVVQFAKSSLVPTEALSYQHM